MLLDPAKEQLYLPTTLIELGNGERRQEKIVGEKHESLLVRSIVVTDSPKPLGISAFGDGIVERDDLVRSKAGPLVDRLREKALAIESFFGPSDEERSREVQTVESFEIEISAIHQVNGAGFPEELVEDIDLVNLSAGDNHYGGNRAPKVQQCVEFDGRFVAAKLSPRKQRQTEIDRGGVQRVDSLIEFDAERFVAVETSRLLDQHLCEVGIDSPVADLVGMGQGVARNLTADAHVIELGRGSSQTRFDVSQALSVGQLSKRHAEKLIPARKAFDFVAALITLDAASKFVGGNKVHQLSKDCFGGIHS